MTYCNETSCTVSVNRFEFVAVGLSCCFEMENVLHEFSASEARKIPGTVAIIYMWGTGKCVLLQARTYFNGAFSDRSADMR